VVVKKDLTEGSEERIVGVPDVDNAAQGGIQSFFFRQEVSTPRFPSEVTLTMGGKLLDQWLTRILMRLDANRREERIEERRTVFFWGWPMFATKVVEKNVAFRRRNYFRELSGKNVKRTHTQTNDSGMGGSRLLKKGKNQDV